MPSSTTCAFGLLTMFLALLMGCGTVEEVRYVEVIQTTTRTATIEPRDEYEVQARELEGRELLELAIRETTICREQIQEVDERMEVIERRVMRKNYFPAPENAVLAATLAGAVTIFDKMRESRERVRIEPAIRPTATRERACGTQPYALAPVIIAAEPGAWKRYLEAHFDPALRWSLRQRVALWRVAATTDRFGRVTVPASMVAAGDPKLGVTVLDGAKGTVLAP